MKNNLLIKYLILSFIFMLFFMFIFIFLYQSIANNNNTKEQIAIDLKTEIEKQNEIKSLDDSLKMMLKEKELLDSHFAKSSDIVLFLDTIEQLGEEVFVKMEVFSVEQPKIKKEIQTEDNIETEDNQDIKNNGLIIDMRILGSFEGIYKFITLLENAPYEIEILSFDIQNEKGQNLDNKNSAPSLWNGMLKVKLISFVL